MLSIRTLSHARLGNCLLVNHNTTRRTLFENTFPGRFTTQQPIQENRNVPPIRNAYEQRPSSKTNWGNTTKPVVKLAISVPSKSPEEVQKWRAKYGLAITGPCPDPILSFEEAPFSERVIAILKEHFPSPLAIQSQGWSLVLTGRNMVGCADTGSGKTVAFLLPLLEHIKLQGPVKFGAGPTAMVMAPTRELAQQIEVEANRFARAYGITVACVFGGQGNRGFQIRQLERSPALIIATPGRLLDLVSAGYVKLDNVSFVVLDEADRMLDMGFGDDLREVMNRVNVNRQICMWTATWPKSVEHLARDYLLDHTKVNVGSEELTANPNVRQLVEVVHPSERLIRLSRVLNDYQGSKVLIFTETKRGCDELGGLLWQRGLKNIATLHGDKVQSQRNNILADFKSGELKVVIATDVAARGLDVKDIDLVINYDFPKTIESYIHRIGRTARAGKKGTSLSYFTPDVHSLVLDLTDVLEAANQNIPPELKDIARQNKNQKRGGGGGGGGHGHGQPPSNKNKYGDTFGSPSRNQQNNNQGGYDKRLSSSLPHLSGKGKYAESLGYGNKRRAPVAYDDTDDLLFEHQIERKGRGSGYAFDDLMDMDDEFFPKGRKGGW